MSTNNPGKYAPHVGAALGFIAFLLIGAVPGLLYGGYAGFAMAGVLFGLPVPASLGPQILTFGGMAFGVTAVLFFFLVVGAMSSTAVWFFGRVIKLWLTDAPVIAETVSEKSGQ